MTTDSQLLSVVVPDAWLSPPKYEVIREFYQGHNLEEKMHQRKSTTDNPKKVNFCSANLELVIETESQNPVNIAEVMAYKLTYGLRNHQQSILPTSQNT